MYYNSETEIDETHNNFMKNLGTIIPPYNIMGSKSKEGVCSIVRQLNPRIHIENS